MCIDSRRYAVAALWRRIFQAQTAPGPTPRTALNCAERRRPIVDSRVCIARRVLHRDHHASVHLFLRHISAGRPAEDGHGCIADNPEISAKVTARVTHLPKQLQTSTPQRSRVHQAPEFNGKGSICSAKCAEPQLSRRAPAVRNSRTRSSALARTTGSPLPDSAVKSISSRPQRPWILSGPDDT